MKIYSEVGEGTTVKMYLRRHFGAVTALAAPSVETAHGRSGECVLVVEDDAEVRAYVVDTLTDLGYDVLQADGAEAGLTAPRVAQNGRPPSDRCCHAR